MQNQEINSLSASDLPKKLLNLHTPPVQLYYRGDNTLLETKPTVGIVGARKFTPYGKDVTIEVATALARAGVVIISGLALGIDSIAHKAAVETGGKTIAVLPSGLNNIYPASHYGLSQSIVRTGGLLVCEYPNNFRPFKHSFLERNRIIAALSDVLIIPEAAEASGSLNTAGVALDLGVPIMAVPGNITSSYSAGTNKLIKTGAHPLTHVEDVFELLGINNTTQVEYIPENSAEAVLLSYINKEPIATNTLLEKSGLDAAVAQTHLTMLEIKGVIKAESGRWTML